jgi:hypothetical protein
MEKCPRDQPAREPMKGSQRMRSLLPPDAMGQSMAPARFASVEADLHEKRSVIDPPARAYQELWFSLVPGDSGGSVDDVATSLANVGRVLHEAVSTLMPADTTSYVSAAELLQAISSTRRANEPHSAEPSQKVIAAVPSVVSDPLALKIVAAADTVVICVAIGRTRISALRRTIELIGRMRIAGCLLIE